MGKRTHGLSSHPLFPIWQGMVARCENPGNKRYAYYGGRGIAVCERWHDPALFIQDMGERPSPEHSLDRIDNDGPYSPENCRWATRFEQANNKQFRHVIECEGRRLTAAQWARELGTSPSMIAQRAERGWTAEMACTLPPRLCPPRLLTYQDETLPLAEWARRTGTDDTTINDRLARGWSLARALSTPPRDRFIVFKGESRRLSEWGRITGIGRFVIHHRLRIGWSIARTLTEPVAPQPRRLLTLAGETKPLAQWAREKGLTPAIIRDRLADGWPVERALTEPKRSKR